MALIALIACANETGDLAGTGGAGGATDETAFPAQGPYVTIREDTENLVYFFPEEIDAQPSWPSLVWFNGASGYTEDFNYNALLQSVASWGFVVVGGKSPGMNGEEADQRSDLLRRSSDAEDALFGRIDESRIAVAGHSLGGFQTTEVSDQYRVAAAIQGAGVPRGSAAALTLFMTSQGDEVVDDSIVIGAFQSAINDAWLANHVSADHNDPRTDGGVYREPLIAFLRWQLASEAGAEAWFVGDDCTLCVSTSWSFDRR